MIRPFQRLARFVRDRKGVSAIEFAIIAPVLILAYFGLAELCGAMLAERKTSHVASSIGNLVAESASLTTSDVTDIFAAGDIIMSPDSTTGLEMRVTCIQENAAGTGNAVLWSEGSGLSPIATGTSVSTLPANLITANQSIIMAEAVYTYNVPVAYLLPAAFTYSPVFYYRPRIVDPIPAPSS
jgi:Flp pilus assembly protein TadG